MTMVIRRATEADSTAISELIHGLAAYFVDENRREEARTFLATLTPPATAHRIRDAAHFRYYVAVDDSGLCGVAALRDESHLYHLFVRADLHGHKLGHRLWQRVLAESYAEAYTVNASLFAVPVYERLGFVACGEAKHQDGISFVPMRYVRDRT